MKKIMMILTVFICAGVLSLSAAVIWYCPMHPNYISDKAGKCPICHMNLVKKEDKKVIDRQEEPVAGYQPLHLNSAQKQVMGIKTVKAVRKPFVRTITALGRVAHDLELYQAQLEYISAWQQYYAFTARRPVSQEFRQDWREYYVKNADRKTSEEFRKAQERLIKAEYELRHMGLSGMDIDKLREIKYGRPWVSPGLLFFSEEGQYWVYAEIFEGDLGFIDVGQRAVVEIPAYAEKVQGTVRAVAESVDPMSRTVRARIELDRYRGELKEGMFVNVVMPVELNSMLMLPRDAVMMTGTRAIVFIQKKDGVLYPREVKTGWDAEGMIAIKSGLDEGEEVVGKANFLVDSESRLQAALEGMSHE